MSLTRDRIESLAPDQASLSAALKLAKPATWPMLAANADASVLWGECQGSGAQPYRVVVSPEDTGYKCTCPSRKFPCKHVLAVLWMRVDKPERFTEAAAPPWVAEWMGRKRSGAPRAKPAADDGAPKAAPSLDAALNVEPEPDKPTDPKAAARAEAQRQRLKAERESAVLGGLDDLDRWLLDQLGQGLAGFAARASSAARTLSPRLVDAKAGGLAGRLDRLEVELFRVAEEHRADLAIERLSSLALIASAYRQQARLPVPLREDVRRAVGWTQKREDLLADASAPRVTTTWIVAANLSEVQPDKLRRLETWLVDATPSLGTAKNATAEPARPRVAVLMDFVPVAGGAFGFAFERGECLVGEVVFYPSAAPLRGLLATRAAAPTPASWPTSAPGIKAALDHYAATLAVLPWLDACPLLVSGVRLRPSGKGLLALADDTGVALAIERSQSEALTPLLGLDGVSLLVLWDGHAARVLTAETAIGRWHGE